ncbi:MAG: PD-(D/E)XK nuclease family protein [Paludibacter sp.]|jgi:CRISPR/Cas system-associated exonuclease Cas4 (RecB family)|nr:PD-(D/E)XK nuclease family protein [Paludibacter sp.]
MKSFLYRVAEALFNQYEYSISDFSFVFPNRRAGLFFKQHLSHLISKPLFAPEILTISDLFESGSNLKIADRMGNLFRLYAIFQKHTALDESFDSFVFWGEMMLSDFDEIDTYRIDARQLFTNLSNIKTIETLFDYLSPEQKTAIEQFWGNLGSYSQGNSQQNFMSIWKAMYPVYAEFSQHLLSQGLATEGMLDAKVCDDLKAGNEIELWSEKKFVFVGFNALNPCEETLFEELQKRSQADFYWDYEAAELKDEDNPASQKYIANINKFPSKITIPPDVIPLIDKKINLIAIPSAVGQTKYVQHIIEQFFPENSSNYDLTKTAIVLPNESLLMPLLSVFPPQIDKINITMGYPLKSTPAAALMELIFELHNPKYKNSTNQTYYYRTVNNILDHQYIAQLCPKTAVKIKNEIIKENKIFVKKEDLRGERLLETIFDSQVSSDNFLTYLLQILTTIDSELNELATESETGNTTILQSNFLYNYFTTINRMNDLLNEELKTVKIELFTLIRLVRQAISGISIPFDGEPLEGLQVMGMLETRGLDFENLIITSFNEGIFPKKAAHNSFIPFNLRKGFGLPVSQMHDAITAYNFYRLISRTNNVYLLYDSRSDGSITGEPSRFILQLQYHYGVKINKINPIYNFALGEPQKIEIRKSPEIMRKLDRYFASDLSAKYLSASAINTYIDCPLRFYLTNIEGIRETEDVKENIEADVFGSIFHAAMDRLYSRYEGKTLNSDDFIIIDSRSVIDLAVRQAFAVNYFKKPADEPLPELEGNLLLISKVIHKYISKVLKIDKENTPFTYVKSEYEFKDSLKIDAGMVNIKGFIDRIDITDNVLRIVDYKTGKAELKYYKMSDIFSATNKRRPKYVVQGFLYGLFYKQNVGAQAVMPCFCLVTEVFKNPSITPIEDKGNGVTISDFATVREEFTENLIVCLNEMFDAEQPFVQTENENNCQYCLHRNICYR